MLFALHRRVRPYNKYLWWELERSRWATGGGRRTGCCPSYAACSPHGDPDTQRALFTDIEEAARKAGHGEVLDSWGTDLELLRHS